MTWKIQYKNNTGNIGSSSSINLKTKILILNIKHSFVCRYAKNPKTITRYLYFIQQNNLLKYCSFLIRTEIYGQVNDVKIEG